MCIEMCMVVCIDMRVAMCIDVHMAMCKDMCVDMCLDMSVVSTVDMCLDMHFVVQELRRRRLFATTGFGLHADCSVCTDSLTASRSAI